MLYMAHPPISTSLQFCCLAIVLLDNVKVKAVPCFDTVRTTYVQKFVCARVSCVTDVTPSALFSFSAFFLPPQPPNGPGGR